MQDKTGGYCPMCDTVWVSPGKCRCEPIEMKDFTVPASEEYCNGWNAAIEAAAKECDMCNDWLAHKIRKLKK